MQHSARLIVMVAGSRMALSCLKKIKACFGGGRTTSRTSACRRVGVVVSCVFIACIWYDIRGPRVLSALFHKRIRNIHRHDDGGWNASMRCIKEDYDNSKRYVILRNVFTANIEHRRDDVTLLTQCDTGKLRYVIELADRWQGPFHVSLYFVTLALKDQVVDLINQIRLCHPNVRQHVTWHFAYPAFERIRILSSQMQKPITAKRPRRNFDVIVNNDVTGYVRQHRKCSTKLLEQIQKFKAHSVSVDPDRRNKNGTYIAYFPMNVLANVARQESKSEFVFFIDADLVPNSGLRNNFIDFARTKNLFGRANPENAVDAKRISVRYLQWATPAPPKTFMDFTEPVCPHHHDNEPYAADVYVVPTFQYRGPDDKIPAALAELKRCHSENRVTRYYGGALFHPYGPTGHVYWLNMERVDHMECAYKVKYHMNYEPYHIARRSYPMYDERFAGHGNVKVSHLAEVASNGYKFKVLNNAFLAHRGWKRKVEKEYGQKILEYNFQKLTMVKKIDELEKAFNPDYAPVTTPPPNKNAPFGNPHKPRNADVQSGKQESDPPISPPQKTPQNPASKESVDAKIHPLQNIQKGPQNSATKQTDNQPIPISARLPPSRGKIQPQPMRKAQKQRQNNPNPLRKPPSRPKAARQSNRNLQPRHMQKAPESRPKM